jgi:CubicO group peptidase (beta-lactamase class C family)
MCSALCLANGIERLDGSRITPDEIDALAARLMKSAEVPGLAIAVVNQGILSYANAYGFRDTDKHLPLTVNSVMDAASLTKVAFAYLVMELVGQGKLDLDKPVYLYLPKPLPDYPSYADLSGDERYKRITSRMLLSHTSGFPNWRWIEDDRKLKIHFEPGTRFAYSGEGIDLLQLVVESVTKRPLKDLMQEHVFEPLGMNRTSLVWQSSFDNDYANGYDEYGRSVGLQRRDKADAAGSMVTTVSDFARFLQATMQGKGLTPKSRQQMLSPQIQIVSKHEFPTFENQTSEQNKAIRLSYGLGWGLFWTPYGKAYFKEGHDDGERNYAVCFEDRKTAMLIMTNSGNGEGIYKGLLEGVLDDTFTPLEWEGFTPYDQLPPRPPLKQYKEVHLDATSLSKYVGRYGDPPNLILVIGREGDHLSIQENDEPKQDLFPESGGGFFAKSADDLFTFDLDAQGRVSKMILHTEGRDIPLKRID